MLSKNSQIKVTKKINIITLGCSKNVVDSEHLMKQLAVGGWEVVHDSNDPSAGVVVVNTCGFIAEAKEESVGTILNLLEAKRKGVISHVYVMGCLSQRYRQELVEELPDVDGFFGVSELPLVLKELDTPLSLPHSNQRMLTTPSHYAYLKISEGCSWGCSFCAIPLIRGKHQSVPIPELLEEAQGMVAGGVRELILVAQDTTFYGKDIYGRRRLPDLVKQLSAIEGLDWVRIHYAYPAGFPMALLGVMRDNPKVCKYLDIPFQHISTKMLTLMRRGVTKEDTLELIARIRTQVPGIALRTTLIVGHPGETESDFEELLEFVGTSRFERLGAFTYSQEEGTHSATLPNSVPDEVMQQRLERVMELQRDISAEHNRSRTGGVYRVLIDRQEGEFLVGRTEFDSPEVDQEVLIALPVGKAPAVGEMVECRITHAEEYDLLGELVPSPRN